ncbi:MAG: hypothetical protein ABI604_10135 [Nitrospirota bacterium]
MNAKKKPGRERFDDLQWHKHVEELLDEALKESFPASDPVAIDFGPLRTKSHEHGQIDELAHAKGKARNKKHKNRSNET